MRSFYQRHLPHYQPSGHTYFVTFRLANSLPQSVLKELLSERELNLKQIEGISNRKEKMERYLDFQRAYFSKFDTILNCQKTGPLWLNQKPAAKIVYDSLIFYDSKKYELLCFTIMPNHVHIVFTPHDLDIENTNKKPNYLVTEIIANLKKFTARECNKILGRTGAFWQHESYDHVIRNEVSLHRTIQYVLNNPVKALLCNTPEEWEWSYLKDFNK